MSGLEDLYREIILDHYRNPRNRGELEVPPAYRAEGFNPLCGDEIVVYLDLGPDGTVSGLETATLLTLDVARSFHDAMGLSGGPTRTSWLLATSFRVVASISLLAASLAKW